MLYFIRKLRISRSPRLPNLLPHLKVDERIAILHDDLIDGIGSENVLDIIFHSGKWSVHAPQRATIQGPFTLEGLRKQWRKIVVIRLPMK
jgi:hypothetical protein